ncbi:MAG: hypothetical protein U0R52_11490 [Solirubrobacterales bacterium]
MSPLLATGDLENGKILLVVALAAVPVATIAFAGVGRALKELGKGRFAIEQELPAPPESGGPPPLGPALREAEVRQMLEAKSYRRVQRGLEPLDIEAEARSMLAAPAEPAGMDARLREEVRQLVVARNERRMRRGEEPLDVESEVDRQLTDLEALGQ